MASWVTHLRIADGVLRKLPTLDRRGFCVGNIAPDCNVENEDWTSFTPPREVTHWMQGARKSTADCDAFFQAYIESRRDKIKTAEEFSFLLGYYAHLLTDAAFQTMVRREDRVKSTWVRIQEDTRLRQACSGMPQTWDSIKKLVPKREWMAFLYSLEAEYLAANPDSGYLTEVLPLREFPDYIDYLPHGAILRKIGVMGYVPKTGYAGDGGVAISREEYEQFVTQTIDIVVKELKMRDVAALDACLAQETAHL